MNTLVDMISGMEVKEDDENYKNAVDYMFDGLAKRKPDCFAVKQYRKFKLSSGKTAKSILISCGARLAPFDIPQLREIMSYDELELDRMGDRRTAIVVLEFTPLFGLIHQLVQRSDFTVLIVSANIAVLLMAVLSILSFDVDRILSHLWVIIILILAVLLLDSILLFLHQRRTQEQKRIHMIEQYVPIVEELISQVRARQHEFNNRMMAIEAAVASADTLEEARKEVAGLTGSIGISLNDRELLSCDSKMIAGMLFGKIKQAEVANLHIELSLHGLFKKTVTPETEWIEAIGILLDNAIEASPKGSTIFLSSKKQGDFLELTVSNPAPPLSNTEFMALFGKGVTTKASRDGHGFGLYNILRMTERYHGKILTRNESILNENYVVFGILMP